MDGPGVPARAPPAGPRATGPVPCQSRAPLATRPRAAGSRPAGRDPAPPRRTRGHLRIIIPIAHGLAASATILLALLTVVTAR